MANPEVDNYCKCSGSCVSKYDSSIDTYKHKQEVSKLINFAIKRLLDRSLRHDDSKLDGKEKEIFDKYTPKLKNTTYGSDEYKQYLKEMQEGLKLHYGHNQHHPEHHGNGIKDMTLFDILEACCDWLAATKRHADGDIRKSIEINQERFGYSGDLKQIFLNTIKELELA